MLLRRIGGREPFRLGWSRHNPSEFKLQEIKTETLNIKPPFNQRFQTYETALESEMILR
jgi:hypothetical protein